MTEEQNEDRLTGFGRIIREAKEEAFHARRALRTEMPNPSIQTKIEVARSLASYADVLQDYKGESALNTDWEDRTVDSFDALLIETTTVERELNRPGHATEEIDIPIAGSIEAMELIALAKELDSIAKELGFAAPAKDKTPNTKATHEDLAGLLSARGQTDALENLPDSWQPEEVEEAES